MTRKIYNYNSYFRQTNIHIPCKNYSSKWRKLPYEV